MIDDQILLRFRFESHVLIKDKLFEVYSNNINDMILFLTQHNFINDNCSIEQLIRLGYINRVHKDELVLDIELEDKTIQHYKFKSNVYAELFTILTTERIVWSALQYVCQELSDVSCYGPLILREDIEFIKIINDEINILQFGSVLDPSLVDGDTDVLSEEYKKVYSERGFEPGECADAIIYDTMFEHSVVNNVQPITVEAYINTFKNLIFGDVDHDKK